MDNYLQPKMSMTARSNKQCTHSEDIVHMESPSIDVRGYTGYICKKKWVKFRKK